MEKEILELLKVIGQEISSTGEMAFDIVVYGMYIEALVYSIFVFLLIVVDIVFLRLAIKHSNFGYDSDSKDFFVNISAIALSVALPFLITTLLKFLPAIFVPEYYAILEIIEVLK